jgi:hypothetical protein
MPSSGRSTPAPKAVAQQSRRLSCYVRGSGLSPGPRRWPSGWDAPPAGRCLSRTCERPSWPTSPITRCAGFPGISCPLAVSLKSKGHWHLGFERSLWLEVAAKSLLLDLRSAKSWGCGISDRSNGWNAGLVVIRLAIFGQSV